LDSALADRADISRRIPPRLRRAEGLIGSIISLLGLTPRVPDHTTLPSFGDRGSPAIAVDAARQAGFISRPVPDLVLLTWDVAAILVQLAGHDGYWGLGR
jgi:hypothetical protein